MTTPTAAFYPALRRDLVKTPGADGGFRVVDPVSARNFELASAEAALAARLDGSRALPALLDELAAAGVARADAEEALRRLMLFNLVEGAGREIVEQLAAVKAGERALDYVILDGARFACQGSGQCCQNYVFGPLSDEDLAGLAALDLATAFPHLGAGPYHDEIEVDGKMQRYLKSSHDRCIFLTDDRRCGLHARFGADAKPAMCRLYPLEYMATIEGIRLYDKGSCSTFAVSARSGALLADDFERVRPLLPAKHSLYHPVVVLPGPAGDIGADYGWFLCVVGAQLELVRRTTAGAAPTLRAVGAMLRGFAAALARCPLAAGEPAAAATALVACDPARFYEAPPDEAAVRAGAEAVAAVADDILIALAGVMQSALHAGKGWLSARLSREAYQLIHGLRAVALQRAHPEAGEVPAHHAALASGDFAPDERPAVDEVLRLSLRQQLFGFRALIDERAAPALLRQAFVHLLAVLGARLQASLSGGRALVAADLSWGHMLAIRLLDRPDAEMVLVQHEDKLPAVLDAIAALTGLH